ncbi:serine/threonine protein kinase-like protein 5 [Dinothrombium tinctorium]|uniref:Serine/threonine protein kinase-like protein 5 n=1 Tax=Dinothrombium tinctorium TaxID=1965070 RepID=A0A3S3RJC2_9ACAR|nr:serine/threonine protein kinase-like protein 5 [Dinothrombium tinctorium]
MSKKKEAAQVDPKTEAVFARKGYKLKDRLAAGAFGQVYSAYKLNEEGELCAVKVMDLEKCSEKFKQKFLPRELSILIQVRHPYVINIFDIFRANRKIYIFMEFAPNGTIADYLKDNGPLTENHTREWFYQSGDALLFIHDQLGIAHRDIKVENILLDQKNNCKLTDFGFARECYDPKTGMLKLSETFCGTEPYYAPEIIEREPYNPFLADVWALGVVLFAMLNNKFPFHYKDLKNMLREQKAHAYKFRPEVDAEISKEVKDLQWKIFEANVNKRPTMAQVMEHPWVKKYKRKN